MRLDLHIHTTASDGALEAHAVVEAAREGGLDVIAVTDHDTMASVEPAREAARGTDLGIVPGTELSSTWEGREIHVLGYGMEPAGELMAAHRERARTRRLERMDRMIHRLAREEGVTVDLDDVLAVAGPHGDVVGRPHLARVLVERGLARDIPDAFDRYLADGRPAFVPTALQTPREAVETIRAAGGVAIWAHPPVDLLDDLLPSLVDAGLQGLEVHRPESSRSLVRRLTAAAQAMGLVTSGGSDWHNPQRNAPLGQFWVGSGKIGPLLELLGLTS